jgi:hypothetical protein
VLFGLIFELFVLKIEPFVLPTVLVVELQLFFDDYLSSNFA